MSTPITERHSIFTGLVSELIGVAILAIVADMNEDLGGIAVALMIGWFMLFLIFNATMLQSLVSKVHPA